MDWREIADAFAIGWNNTIHLVTAVVSVLVALLVARLVSGRDDQRQRNAERRAVQRETIIAPQDGWFEMDQKLTHVLYLIQTHQSIARRQKAETDAEFEAHKQGESFDTSPEALEKRWEQQRAKGEELNRSGDDQNKAVLGLRQFAKRIELLESRVSDSDVKGTSRSMRECLEGMIRDVANEDGKQAGLIRSKLYDPAYDRFIQAGYEVLADIEASVRDANKAWRTWVPPRR